MAKAKLKVQPNTPWLRFLAALDADAKSGGIVRRWVNSGCDLQRIFTYAVGPANPHVAQKLGNDMAAKQSRGRAYTAGAKTALRGLEAMARALGDGPELEAPRVEAEQMAATLRQRLANAPEAFGVKRWGASDHVDAYTLAGLRAYTGGSVEQVVRVAEVAVKACKPGVGWSIEAAEKALRRFEARNPQMVGMLRASAGGSR